MTEFKKLQHFLELEMIDKQNTKGRWIECETCDDCDGKGSILYGEGPLWTALYKLEGALKCIEKLMKTL